MRLWLLVNSSPMQWLMASQWGCLVWYHRACTETKTCAHWPNLAICTMAGDAAQKYWSSSSSSWFRSHDHRMMMSSQCDLIAELTSNTFWNSHLFWCCPEITTQTELTWASQVVEVTFSIKNYFPAPSHLLQVMSETPPACVRIINPQASSPLFISV